MHFHRTGQYFKQARASGEGRHAHPLPQRHFMKDKRGHTGASNHLSWGCRRTVVPNCTFRGGLALQATSVLAGATYSH